MKSIILPFLLLASFAVLVKCYPAAVNYEPKLSDDLSQVEEFEILNPSLRAVRAAQDFETLEDLDVLNNNDESELYELERVKRDPAGSGRGSGRGHSSTGHRSVSRLDRIDRGDGGYAGYANDRHSYHHRRHRRNRDRRRDDIGPLFD